MRRSWVGSVVAGLLVLAPVVAVAQSGLGDEPETTEVVSVANGKQAEGPGTLALVNETETTGPGEGEGEGGEDASGGSNDHGERVSTVARCAPTGKLDIEGFRNHGAFVRAAAHGETIEVPGAGTFDLSSPEGVEALCAWAETYAPDTGSDPVGEVSRGSVDTDEARAGGRGEPDRVGERDHVGKPDGGSVKHNGRGNGRGKGARGR